jgi:GT2 family glycosyltransferase
LNEEKTIRRAIESALAAVERCRGEVVIADSVSSDHTIEIAKLFPVTIVQIKNAAERCCGIGPQLGYQHARGDYVYILDGDMELDSSFLQHAIDILDSEPDVAGVGGYVHEVRVHNLELQGRIKRLKRLQSKKSAQVRCLDGGGLYRRAAIDDVGYLSDRNLYAFEEYDLGARLRSKGWRLVRLTEKAVSHYSYDMSSWSLLWYRTRCGRFLSLGQLFRAAVSGRYVRRMAQELRAFQLVAGVWFYWLLVAMLAWLQTAHWKIALFSFALAAPLVGMSIRQRSLMLGVYSVITWHFNAVGYLIGRTRRRRSPAERIESLVLQRAAHDADNGEALTIKSDLLAYRSSRQRALSPLPVMTGS